MNDLPNELPFAKLWTGGWCPLAFGNPAPLGPGTSQTACIKCTEGCAVCPEVFYDCVVCIPGYGLSDGACRKLGLLAMALSEGGQGRFSNGGTH